MLSETFQVTLHECPRAFTREMNFIFPNVIPIASPLFALITCQHACVDLSQFNDEADREKDHLLETFMDMAKQLCTTLHALGYWADYIDPCSGLPMLTSSGNTVYSEVEGLQRLLHYNVVNAGTCKIILHPVWGAKMYPASLFTTAPSKIVLPLLQKMSVE